MQQHSVIKQSFLCADINMTEAVSIDEALKTGIWIDVGTRYAEEDEAEPTCADFSRIGTNDHVAEK